MMLDMILPTATSLSRSSSASLAGDAQAGPTDSGVDVFAQLLLQATGDTETPVQALITPWPNGTELSDRQLLAQMIAENSSYPAPAIAAPMAEALRQAINDEAALLSDDHLIPDADTGSLLPDVTDLDITPSADDAIAVLQPVADTAVTQKVAPAVAATTVLPTAAQQPTQLETPAARPETPVLQANHAPVGSTIPATSVPEAPISPAPAAPITSTPTTVSTSPAAATSDVPAPLLGDAPLGQSVHEPLSTVGAAQPTSATNTLAATQAAQAPGVNAPLNTPAWGRELGQQVVIAARTDEQQISLRLNPANLGPLQIELKVLDQQAQVQFLSPHAQVRGAVEQAIPQLREALAEQGITLADTSVGEQRQQQQDPATDRRSAYAGHSAADAQGDDIATVAEPVQPLADGRINVYV